LRLANRRRFGPNAVRRRQLYRNRNCQGFQLKLTIDSILSKQETRWSGLREVLLLAFPIILTVGSNTLMNATDTWMVAQLGKEHMAAIVSSGILNYVLVAFFIGVISCVSTFVSQSYGRNLLKDCSHYAWQGVHVSLIIGAGCLMLLPFTSTIFGFVNHEEKVQALECTYFNYRLLGMGGAIMSVALGSFFQATGRPIVPMIATIGSNVFNLLGDYALIFGNWGFPQMGIAGAAIATNAAAWICALSMLGVFLTKGSNRHFATWSTWKWDGPKARQLFRIGWPAGLSLGMDAGSWAIFVNVLVGRFDTDTLAAGGIVGQIMMGSFMPTVGLSLAVTALVGQWIGRRRVDIAKARYRTALKIGVTYMTIMGLLFVIFRNQLVGLFISDPATGQDVLKYGGNFLMFAAAFQFFDAISIVTSGALKGAGDTKWPMAAGMISAWFIFLPLGYVLSFHTSMGVYGAWFGANVYIYLLGASLFWRFLSGKWQKIDIFDASESFPVITGEQPETETPGEQPVIDQADRSQEDLC